MSRRVVVTGIGLVTPLGIGNGSEIFRKLVTGMNGIQKISAESNLIPTGCSVHVAATVPTEDLAKFEKRNEKEVSKFIHYALISSNIALADAGIKNIRDFYESERVGVAIANGGIGSLADIVSTQQNLDKSYRKVSPYFVPKILTNLAAGQVSIRHGLKGPVHCVTTACAAGAHGIGDAFNFIRLGYADCMLAGSSDACVDPLAIAGFARMKALSTTTETNASRPFDANRNGFVIGEGAGILILEELSAAKKRNAPIIAELCGYGLSGDAYHTTSPSTDGDGATRCMNMALKDAKVPISQVGYVNAHSTSTPLGDDIEINAISKLLSSSDRPVNPLYISSTKSSTGHLLGGAGSVEAAFTALSLLYDIIPPTLHLDTIDPNLQNDALYRHVPKHAIRYADHKVLSEEEIELKTPQKTTGYEYALKNSFGFGGTNASLVFKRYSE